jgi:4-aminobutyrate aminotransferase-like enzyme
MLVTGDVADVLMASPEGFPVGHTFSGYPLGCAVGAEMVRVIRDEGILDNARLMGERLRAGLERVVAGSPHVGQVRGLGLLQGIELVEDRTGLEPRPGAAARVADAARERGLMIYCCPTALGGRVIQCVMLAPPLNISADDVDEILDRLEPAIGAA